ncbi:MAG: CoA-transferase [Candidatus Parvarchaeota archaeon]
MDVHSREIMAIQAAKEINDLDVVLVGVGLPNLAANFAKRMYSPNITLIYESGSIDCFPRRQPLSIGDPSLSENVSALYSIFDTFSYLITGGKIDVGYLAAAQVDIKGRLNTTVIGDYHSPKVRLPGSGGACEILYYSKKSVVILEFSEEKIKREVDFVTSAVGPTVKGAKGKISGKEVIITDKCIIDIMPTGIAEIRSVYENTNMIELTNIAKKIGISVPNDVNMIGIPTVEEIKALEEMDPTRAYLR